MNSRKIVVITGASAGVGRATAKAFAVAGSDVALLARGRQGLEAAVAEVRGTGARALTVVTDVADPEQVEAAAERVERELGPIDVWVNNAMVSVFAELEQMTPEEFKRVTDVTYLGYVYGTMAALKRMRPRERGVIVQVGSALAHRAIPLQSAYSGAKHAVRGFTDALRAELRQQKSQVRLTMVQMPALNTPQFNWARAKLPREPQPVPPIYQPEVAAQAIVWASQHKRRELWVGSSTVEVITASAFFPGLVDRYLGALGYRQQMTEERRGAGRPDNLFRPAEGNFGTHGRFDARARKQSWHLWLTTHVPAPAIVDGIAGALSGAKMLAMGSWQLAHREAERPRGAPLVGKERR